MFLHHTIGNERRGVRREKLCAEQIYIISCHMVHMNNIVLQDNMDGIKEEPESDHDSRPSSPLEEYEPIFIKTEPFEPDTLPIMKCEAVVSLPSVAKMLSSGGKQDLAQ
jgi:hypothetical protein